MTIDREKARLYATLPAYKKLVGRTERFIADSLEKVRNPYVAMSFGKDSAAMLHLVRKERPDIPALFIEYDETPYLDNYEEVIGQWQAMGLILIRHKVITEIDEQVNEKNLMPAIAASYGFDSAFVGIRAEESKGRRITLRMFGDFYQNKAGHYRICPLANWSTDDVAAYNYAHNLPMLNSYVVSGIHERTTNSLANDEFSFRHTQLTRLKKMNITKFNAIIARWPELKKYV